jgi:hypothetical protein
MLIHFCFVKKHLTTFCLRFREMSGSSADTESPFSFYCNRKEKPLQSPFADFLQQQDCTLFHLLGQAIKKGGMPNVSVGCSLPFPSLLTALCTQST